MLERTVGPFITHKLKTEIIVERFYYPVDDSFSTNIEVLKRRTGQFPVEFYKLLKNSGKVFITAYSTMENFLNSL